MKKHLHNSLRALFLSLAVLLSLPMLAVEVEIDGINYELVAKVKQATVIKKSSGKYSGEVVIPETVEYNGTVCNVTSIGGYAFYECSGLTSVTIPNSVTSIGRAAFDCCYGLTSVHISDIAAWCNIDFEFYNPSGYTYISNPLYYAHHLYLNGEEVKDLVIPNSVTSIGENAFAGCSGLTSVTIPNSVTRIGEGAFSGCSGLTSVHISDIAAWCNIDFGGGNPLYYAQHLYLNGEEVKDLVIPNSVTSIGDDAFSGWSGLTSVTIPNSVESIGDGTFNGCSGLTSVTIPNSVTSIGGSAFSGCSGLTSVTIGNSVTSIGGYAFHDCSGLTSVTIPNSVTSIGQSAFYGCSGLTSVTIPNSVTSIEYYAFRGCSGLTSVTIPNSVTSIRDGAFRNCPELLDVYCYAEKVPSTKSDAFEGSYPEYSTLYVPHTSIEDYKKEAPWSTFGTIKAIPGTERYTITFMLEGTEFHKDTLVAGSSITLPEAPEKEGHTFNGWKDVPETMPANDVVIVGDYSVNKYLLTFKIGDEVLSADSVEYGAKIGTPQAPEKEGHTFNGWENVPETMPANDVVIVGDYSVNKYLLTFKIGDEVLSADSVEYGAKIETPQAPEKEGHTFNGWKDVPETMPANDVVIVGDYSVNKYLLTFKIGDEVIVADSVEYGAKIETPVAPEKEGHTFCGWKDVPDTMPANDVVANGSYSVNIYKVYYYVGDELVHTDEVAYGESIPAYEYTPTNGDKFMGWDGEQYDTMPAHDVTYIANIESSILNVNGDMSNYQIYDLNGRKIENVKNLKSGVYIVNGKKTIIKVN